MDLYSASEKCMLLGEQFLEPLTEEELIQTRDLMLEMKRDGWMAWKERNASRTQRLLFATPTSGRKWLQKQSDRLLLLRSAYEHCFAAGVVLQTLESASDESSALALVNLVHEAANAHSKEAAPWPGFERLDPASDPSFYR